MYLYAQEINPAVVDVTLHKAYIPMGFDSNDRAQVMVESYLPDTCYKIGPHKVVVDEKEKKITIQQTAYKYSGFCLLVIVPYYHMVDFGILKAGAYTLEDGRSHKALGQLPVKTATNSSADDAIYAPVNEATVVRNEDGSNLLKLAGTFTNSCMSLKNIEVLYESSDVITVLPITEIKDEEECKSGEFPFTASEQLKSLEKGRYFLHVRSLNGSSVTKLFDVK